MQTVKIVTYLGGQYGFFAQYCRRNAGFYPDLCRKTRRAAEIAAHSAGVRQAETFECAGKGVVVMYRNKLAGPKGHLP